MPMMRYPGSKTKIATGIMSKFPDEIVYPLSSSRHQWEYREPFFGAGAIGIQVLELIHTDCAVWINDLDPHVAALWRAIRNEPEALIAEFYRLTPSVDLFYQLKEEDGAPGMFDHVAGARKMLLHAMSRSGFGFKAGGPIGGRNQDNPVYDIECRWNPEAREEETRQLHRRISAFRSFKITCLDFAEVIRGAGEECFIYADPPYVKAGPQLYKHSLDDADHQRLADCLRECQASWVLSYDGHDTVRRLYNWANIEDVAITYTCSEVSGTKRRKNSEVVITPKR